MDPSLGWRKLVSGPLACEEIACLHEVIMKPPHLEAVAKVFGAAPWTVEVVGPALVAEALAVHEGFW